MSTITPSYRRTAWNFLLLATAAACAGAVAISTPAAAQSKIPQLMQSDYGWISVGPFLDPPAGMRGPIQAASCACLPRQPRRPRPSDAAIGNHDDPVLKPWVAAHMKATSDAVLNGKTSLPFTAQSRCYPGGVPGQLLYPI